VAPERCGDELQQGDDVLGTGLRAWRFAVEEEIEEFETERVSLGIESVAENRRLVSATIRNLDGDAHLSLSPFLPFSS
jgi:hypothetical protein